MRGLVVEGAKDASNDAPASVVSVAELLVTVAMLVELTPQPTVMRESRRTEYSG